ncbi:hypothetical protein L1887_32034 [Cichorium endivia]|nr:hypothetical protein L1887_32034 [Cichorium endivia]
MGFRKISVGICHEFLVVLVSNGRKSCSCFSALRGLDEQQYYAEGRNSSAHFRQPRVCSESSDALQANSVEEVTEEEAVDMSPEFFQGFLAIGTLGSISITEEAMTPKVAMAVEAAATENEVVLSLNKLEKLNEKKEHDVSNESMGKVVTINEKEIRGMNTKVNESMVMSPLKEYSEMPATKEEARKQKTMPINLLKKSETHAMHFMKKMLKKLDFTSRCIPTSANICDSVEKKPTKLFRKSRKIHPEAADPNNVCKSYNYKVKNTGFDEGNTHPREGMLKKETVSCYPTGEKAHWIKTDEDYFVLEF